MSQSVQQSKWYAGGFEQFEKSLNGSAKSALHQKRQAGFTEFARLGFPTAKNEEWRFTNISAIAKTDFHIIDKASNPKVTSGQIEQFLLGDSSRHQLVFINGYFSEEHSSVKNLPAGVTVSPLSKIESNETAIRLIGSVATNDENAFNALNTAFIRDGIYIKIDDGVTLEEPVFCLYLTTGWEQPFAVQPRNLIIAGKRSGLNFIEQYASLDSGVYFTNAVTEILVDDEANVHHTKIQNESEHAYHIATIHVHQNTRSAYTSDSIALGGTLVRNNILSRLGGEHIECTMNGLSLGTGEQLIDNHTTIDHAMPNCVSHELYKAILDGKSRGVFNGKIFVRKDAQKTDAKQTNKTLLLSDDAIMDTKPQLEIFADDVKCTHGATIGQLDDEQVFYLRSRGFSRNLARDILTTAFANNVIDKIANEQLRERLYEMIFKKLHEGRNTAV